jgi:hypothetical protein
MFHVLLICGSIDIINYNIEILKGVEGFKLYIIDYKNIFDGDVENISMYKFINKDKKYCINESLKYINDGDVIIIDENNKIDKHFPNVLKSHYNSSSLNIFRVDTVRDVILTDVRIGKSVLNAVDIGLDIGFNTRIVNNIHKIYNTFRNRIIFQKNIRILKYVGNNMKIRRNPLSRPTQRQRNINALLSNKQKNRRDPTYDIIIPFMYNEDRFELFEESIKCLYKHFKDNDKVNIIVHETAPDQFLDIDFINKYDIKYMYSEWNEVFHRAWALNVPAKHLSTASILIFFDADLLITDEWVNELLKCNQSSVYIGWGKMFNLDQYATKHYIKTGELLERYERIRIPNPNAAAGGINIIPSDIFFDVCGWDESFRNTYGGEDNVLYCKLLKLGYKPNNFFRSSVYHLYHAHKTYRNPKRFTIYRQMAMYSRKKWLNHIKNRKWGEFAEHTIINPTSTDISIDNYKNNERMIKPLNILWCKMDTSNRVAGHYDHLIRCVEEISNLNVFRKNIGDEHPAIFQQKMINGNIKDNDVDYIIKNQHKFDCVILTQSFAFRGAWENVNIPVFMILEDQHGDNNRYQIKQAIKYGWYILTRYKPKPFNKDINDKVKKWIWYPHSVNTEIFNNYGLEKDIVLLQTGAIYPVYETRVFVKEYFDGLKKKLGSNWYRYIPRPKETDKVKWPVGIEYAQEINKAWLTLCCGSKMKYPVMKYFEIPAAGSIVYGDYFDELGDLGFIPDENMIQIDKSDIMGQLHSIRGNKNFMNDIIYNGMELIRTKYSMEKGAERLIKRISENI